MKQRNLAESGYERRSKLTKRQRFLAEMEAVIPCVSTYHWTADVLDNIETGPV